MPTTLTVQTISGAITKAAVAYRRALKTWYPQHGDNAPAERNLTLHLAFALKETLPDVCFYAESNKGKTNRERVDLVAYEPSIKGLVVVEAKRFLEGSPRGLERDARRILEFTPTNSNRSIEASRKFGVLLTQTIEDANAEWWKSHERGARGRAWAALQSHLARYQDGVGAASVHKWVDGAKRERQRHLLWSVWECPLQEASERD